MTLLSQHIIQGAAHDSSARSPPPRCHPDTRVKLIARTTAWFEGEALQELLLWITGPAGVGKSAIVQTFAEYLAKSKSLGASVFISRPNKRNNPNGIFITIAYQLSTRIEAYRNYIVERISLDPELLRGDMEAQFATFIVEPFVERKIGAGGKRWGILLDGLDELRGEDPQCNIIQLISTFVRDHGNVPLAWIIASRPESHISNTFEDDEVRRSCCTEYIPIDSTEACEDVERFLRSSFKAIQRKYRQSLPNDWPSDTDFLQLTVAASGLFVYAQVVMEFIRDPDCADPALRFEILISVISRSTDVPTSDNPFVHLDAVYHEILSSIPPTHWGAAKLLLGFTVYEIDYLRLQRFRTLRGMSILFSLSRNTVYASLTKCRSALKIPDWKVAHKENLTFLHASFADYLKDSRRSADYYVGDISDIERVVASNLVELWKQCSGDDIAPGTCGVLVLILNVDVILFSALVESTWLQYCSTLGGEKPSSAVSKLHADLFHGTVSSVSKFPLHIWVKRRSSMADLYELPLLEVHMAKLCYHISPIDLGAFVDFEVHDPNSQLQSRDSVISQHGTLSSDNIKLCRKVQLGSLKFGHLDWKGTSPAKVYQGKIGIVFKKGLILNRVSVPTLLRFDLS
jgi:hypothetical protein